ncbi:MAG: hypothetical protein ACWGMZ_03570 [Thermoguttaceae bacterium]
MWCRHCQQDVPAIASGERKYCCPRCGEAFDGQRSSKRRTNAASANSPSEALRAEEIPAIDNWETDEELLHLGRILRIDKACLQGGKKKRYSSKSRPVYGIKQPEPFLTPPALSALLGKKSKTTRIARPAYLLAALTWITLSLGLVGIVCGGVFLGLSVYLDHADFWTLGLPIVAAGQIILLIGLLLKLDRIWRDNRHAVATLDDKIIDLKSSTNLLTTVHGPSSTAFYSHLAGGANPQVLLSDLKSQLDLLAIKLSQQD